MKCECIYCLYNHDKTCILEDIDINIFGMCDDYIITTIPDEVLDNLKKEQLKI